MKYSDDNKPLSPEDPVSSKIFFEEVLNKLKIDLSSPEHLISVQWEALVGANLAPHSKFCGIKDGILNVVCDNGSFASLFRMSSCEILKNVRSVFPELNINKVNVRIK